MTRLLLVLALVAVGVDAYIYQGFYTRAAVGQIEAGIHRLSAATSDARNSDTPATNVPERAPQP